MECTPDICKLQWGEKWCKRFLAALLREATESPQCPVLLVGIYCMGISKQSCQGRMLGSGIWVPQIWYLNSVPWSYFLKNTQLTHITICVCFRKKFCLTWYLFIPCHNSLLVWIEVLREIKLSLAGVVPGPQRGRETVLTLASSSSTMLFSSNLII